MNSRRKTGKPHHGRKYHVYRSGLHNFIERLSTSIYLDVRLVAQQLFQLIITGFVGNHHSCRLELMSLLCQQLHLVIGGETIHLVEVAVLCNDIQRLRTNTAGRA